LFQTDEAGVLKCLLEGLSDPRLKDWRDRGLVAFSVEASVTASLAGVAVVALIVRPVFEREVDAREFLYLSRREVEGCGDALVTDLTARLAEHAQHVGATPAPPPRIQVLDVEDEASLFAGRHFREVRFGLPRYGAKAAATCGELVRAFSKVLRSHASPIAYIHYPHRWNTYEDERWDWLRVAFAVDPTVGRDAAIEISAWSLGSERGLPVAAYDPQLPGRFMSDRFSRLSVSEDRAIYDGEDHPTEDYSTQNAAKRVGLCLQGVARVGLVADVLDAEFALDVFGCTISVLHGHTIANLILSTEAADALEKRLGDTIRSHRFPIETNIVVARPSSETTTFWVAWLTGERTGLINTVLDLVYDEFTRHDKPLPNILYEGSRVLVEGYSCAGKLKFSCASSTAEEIGLLDGESGSDTRSISTSSAAGRITTALRQRLLSAGDDPSSWRPPNPSWSRVPFQVSGSEPREEPWGTLGLPEAELELSRDR
jgi:hypothetical protein